MFGDLDVDNVTDIVDQFYLSNPTKNTPLKKFNESAHEFSLHLDIIQIVFEFLEKSPQNVITFAKLNKQFYDISMKEAVWKNLLFDNFPQSSRFIEKNFKFVFSQAWILRSTKRSAKNALRIAVAGPKNSGKSTIISTIYNNPKFLNQEKKIESDQKIYELIDKSEQDLIKYDEIDGFLVTLYLSDPNSQKETEEILSKLIKGFPTSHLLLIGSKSDLEKKISFEDGKTLSERTSCLQYMETSSSDPITIEKSFLRMIYSFSGVWFPETIWTDLAEGKRITARRRESKAPQKGKRKSCLLM